MNTALNYALTTSPFPVQASGTNATSVQVTVVATNPTPDTPVVIHGVEITLSVGVDATDLVADASLVSPVPPAGWPSAGTTTGTGTDFIFVFGAPNKSVSVGSHSLVFVLNNVCANGEPGTTCVTITEGSNDCTLGPDGNCPTQQLPVTKFPNGWGEVNFYVAPSDITVGDSVSLNWDGPQGTYQIQYADGGTVVTVPATPSAPPLASSGQYPGTSAPALVPQASTTFTLSVSDTISNVPYYAQIQKQVTVAVGAPLITSFDATLQSLNLNAAQMVVELNWTTTNASALHIDNMGTFDGAQALQGSTTTTMAAGCSLSFFVTAYGLVGYSGPPASQNFKASLPAPTINTFVASTDAFATALDFASEAISPVIFAFDVSNIMQLRIEPGGFSTSNGGTVPTSMSHTGTLPGTAPASLTLTAQGCDTVTASPVILDPTTQTPILLFNGKNLRLPSTFPEANFFGGIALNGWPAVSIVAVAKANQVLAVQQAFPSKFNNYVAPDGGVAFNGTVGNWQLLTGGVPGGAVLNLQVSVNGTLDNQPLPTGLHALLQVQLDVKPLGITVTEATSVAADGSITPNPALDSPLTLFFQQHASALDAMLCQLSPVLTLPAAPVLLVATSHAFRYADDILQKGWFYTFCQLSGCPGTEPLIAAPLPFPPTMQVALVLIDR